MINVQALTNWIWLVTNKMLRLDHCLGGGGEGVGGGWGEEIFATKAEMLE